LTLPHLSLEVGCAVLEVLPARALEDSAKLADRPKLRLEAAHGSLLADSARSQG
jgi:hypothetical protein